MNKLLYEGKTKTVYQLENGNNLLFFKDDVTSTDGVFDPGANESNMQIKDNGYYGLLLSKFLFEEIEKAGIKTHYISADLDNRTMEVKPVSFFGKGVEVICRLQAKGSFMRRFGMYAKEDQALDYYTEISLKDDERGDPFISKELLDFFGILTPDQYDKLISDTVAITKIVEKELNAKGITLIDIKLEYGLDNQGEIVLIDELSGGNMRAVKQGKGLEPIELTRQIIK